MGENTRGIGVRYVATDDTLMRDIIGWDVLTWSTAIDYWDATLGATDAPLTCLEIGAGPGGPSLWLALKGHTVLCSNYQNAREQALPLHERYGVTDRITYEDIDAKNIPYENAFDLIVFKSVIGGVGSDGGVSQQQTMDALFRALKPGGMLLFAENIRGTIFHRAVRGLANRLRHASWYYVPYRQLRSMLKPFVDVDVHTTGVLAVFGVREWQRRALARADRAFVNAITPAGWRYMAYGRARKPAATLES